MLPDFEMVVHQIPTTEDITIVPIFDVHLGAQECREQDFIAIVVDNRNNTVQIVPFKVITATSWIRSGGYSLQKLLTPTSHALQTITLSGDHKEMVVTM